MQFAFTEFTFKFQVPRRDTEHLIAHCHQTRFTHAAYGWWLISCEMRSSVLGSKCRGCGCAKPHVCSPKHTHTLCKSASRASLIWLLRFAHRSFLLSGPIWTEGLSFSVLSSLNPPSHRNGQSHAQKGSTQRFAFCPWLFVMAKGTMTRPEASLPRDKLSKTTAHVQIWPWQMARQSFNKVFCQICFMTSPELPTVFVVARGPI